MPDTITSSPSPVKWRFANEEATRLMASVVPRVKTTSRWLRALMKPATWRRTAS